MDKPDDRELVRRCRHGDMRAFETLLARYENPVFNAAYRMLANADDASDVTQTVFLKAWEKLGSYDPHYKFFSWIYRIALNESVDCLKRRSKSAPLDREPESTTSGPEEAVDRAIRDRQIQSALMELKPDYRAVIVLKHFMDCHYAEISRILDIPEQTVKSRLYSARQLLKTALMPSHTH